ncbi:MAG: hypothetical protein CBD26_03345 [Candidatus Pelagibacter sp. TMED166]|nr:MAG: hypothetical protein CBD26_03345 [Candidatus Pelagibacter sp. TMED166]|tara:strand:- start:4234 stop:5856 length:1623 start_codon:yes stop_codon:yes gene_type:complete
MNYKVLSRKYRPQNFNEIIGQPHIVDTLINSISSNRLAHGYLFSGLRGVGKTTTARVLAKTLNCLDLQGGQPCGKCQNCMDIAASRSLDVIELDGASNRGIDEIREIKETVKYPPISGKYKIYIIDEVHMLTKEAFNALLKTLEEPPNNVVFILATTDSHKIPETILSRTLRFDFKKITNKNITRHISKILEKENINFEELALNMIAKKSDGSVRDALSILDRIISYSRDLVSYDIVKESLGIIEDEIYINLLDLIIQSDQNSLILKVKEITDSGYSIENFVGGFNTFLSNGLLFISGYSKEEFLSESVENWFNSKKNIINSIDFMRIIEEIQKFEITSRNLLQPDIALEALFIKLSLMENSIQISDLLLKLDNQTFEDKSKINQNKHVKQINDSTLKAEDLNSKDKIKTVEPKNIELDEIKTVESKNIELDEIKEQFNNYWKSILNLIDEKDKRISSSLHDQKVSINNNLIEIDLGQTDNIYEQKMLNENIDIIENSIYEILKHHLKVKIKVIIKNEEQEKNHPLLDEIKSKFTNSNNS